MIVHCFPGSSMAISPTSYRGLGQSPIYFQFKTGLLPDPHFPATRFFLWLRLCFLSFLILLAISLLNWGRSSSDSPPSNCLIFAVFFLYCFSRSLFLFFFFPFSFYHLLVSVYTSILLSQPLFISFLFPFFFYLLHVSVYTSIHLSLSFFLCLSLTLYPSSSHLHQIFS